MSPLDGFAYRTAESTRPRVWVRGVAIAVTPRPWDLAGAQLKGAPLRLVLGAEWDDHEDITTWRRVETFVAQADLPEEERQYSALAAFPRLARLCARSPIRVVRGAELALLRDRDVRLFTVGFACNEGDYLTCVVEQRGVLIRSVTGGLAEIARSADVGPGPDLAERVIHAATDGIVDGHALALARLARFVLGGDASDERELRALRDDLERELDEIDTRAASMRGDAEEMARRLRDHDGGLLCPIPVYGVARRARHPELIVRRFGEGDFAVDLQGDRETLTIPSRDKWFVENVAQWEPPTRAIRLARERRAVVARMWRDRVVSALMAVAFGTMLLLVIVILAHAACRGH